MQQDRNVSLFVVLVAASAATAGLIFGYDVAVMNGALVFLWAAFHLGRVETKMVQCSGPVLHCCVKRRVRRAFMATAGSPSVGRCGRWFGVGDRPHVHC